MKSFKITDNHKYFAFLFLAAIIIWWVLPNDLGHFIGLFLAIAVMFFGVGKKLDQIHEDVKSLEDKIGK
ncbi:MAG: hypothetical protein MRY79_06770 [Alphaproteobacteria bacterium]|nr:hypothetical protein [Alphaproteobacteria bacterium]